MWKYFILSGPLNQLHICNHLWYRQFLKALYQLSSPATVSSTFFCHSEFHTFLSRCVWHQFNPFLPRWTPLIFATVSSTHFCHSEFHPFLWQCLWHQFQPFLPRWNPPIFATVSSAHFCHSELHPFLAVKDSSIGDLVTHSLTHWVRSLLILALQWLQWL